MTSQTANSEKPWYREPWLWIVLTPLILVVMASTVIVTLAVSSADDIVVDNYYKEGRMLAQEHRSDDYAKSLGLSASLRFDDVTGELVLKLNQNLQIESLVLLLSHPARAALDRTLPLKRVSDGHYIADIPSEVTSGRWYLRLSQQQESGEDLWRLHGEIDLSRALETELE